MSKQIEEYIVPVVFAIIFFVGVLGNGLLIFAFLRHRNMRNVPNTYIMSLALADLLVIVTCVPFTSIAYTVNNWLWGESICKLSETMKDFSIGVSAFTLTALAADTFFEIVDPFHKLHATGGGRLSLRLTVTTAVLIWILAIICAVPAGVGSSIESYTFLSGNTLVRCYRFSGNWHEYYTKVNVIAKFLIFYAIPLTVIAVFYALIAWHLVLGTKSVPGEETQDRQKQKRVQKKVAITVLTFVVVFAICFLPDNIFMLLWYVFDERAAEKYNDFWHYFYICGFCLTFLKLCVNPIVLYYLNGTFRKHFNISRYLFCKLQGSAGERATSMPLTQSHRQCSVLSNEV